MGIYAKQDFQSLQTGSTQQSVLYISLQVQNVLNSSILM